MTTKDELVEVLNSWAVKYYYPLKRERDRYREAAQKWLLKYKEIEKENKLLKGELKRVKKS